MINPAWKHEVLESAASSLKPRKDTTAGWLEQLKLDRAPGFLLDDNCPRSDIAAGDEITDHDLHQVATSQLGIHREIEKRSIT